LIIEWGGALYYLEWQVVAFFFVSMLLAAALFGAGLSRRLPRWKRRLRRALQPRLTLPLRKP